MTDTEYLTDHVPEKADKFYGKEEEYSPTDNPQLKEVYRQLNRIIEVARKSGTKLEVKYWTKLKMTLTDGLERVPELIEEAYYRGFNDGVSQNTLLELSILAEQVTEEKKDTLPKKKAEGRAGGV